MLAFGKSFQMNETNNVCLKREMFAKKINFSKLPDALWSVLNNEWTYNKNELFMNKTIHQCDKTSLQLNIVFVSTKVKGAKEQWDKLLCKKAFVFGARIKIM